MKLIRLIFDDLLKGLFYLCHAICNALKRLHIEDILDIWGETRKKKCLAVMYIKF